MSEPAIRVESLGKRYLIGTRGLASGRLSDLIGDFIASPWRYLNPLGIWADKRDSIWALRNVSFEVRAGEMVGIIGRNGAGKSTLLKILARITEPSDGFAEIRGKLSSLLEVGIGFHPDLTGRENVYLNGVILGMKKAEIDRKFDEIVSFAEVEGFIDTPMKRYSSGMYVRLAFAVAAHLESDILLVDEVLAVGDSAFQNKCLGKLSNVAAQGRTVLFVSHNMPSIMSICPRSILIHKGAVLADGQTHDVLDRYYDLVEEIVQVPLSERADRTGSQALRFTGCRLKNASGAVIPCALSGEDVTIALQYEARNGTPLHDVRVILEMYGRFHESLFQISTDLKSGDFHEIPPAGEINLKIPQLPLQAERYSFDLHCSVAGTVSDYIQSAAIVAVESGDYFGSGKLPQQGHGNYLLDHSWEVSSSGS